MAVSRQMEQPYRVRFDECGPDGRLRASGFLRYAQDMAWAHSDHLGFGRAWYAERRLNWLIRAVELDVMEAVAYGSTLSVSTEVLGFRRAWARRRSLFTDDDGQRVLAEAVIDWMLLDRSGRPTSVPPDLQRPFGVGGRATFAALRVRLPDVPADASVRRFPARRSELDPMGHVNNAAYLDFIDEHVAEDGRAADLRRLPRRYTLEYLAAAEPGRELVGSAWPTDVGLCYRLTGTDGHELLRARLDVDRAAWVGG